VRRAKLGGVAARPYRLAVRDRPPIPTGWCGPSSVEVCRAPRSIGPCTGWRGWPSPSSPCPERRPTGHRRCARRPALLGLSADQRPSPASRSGPTGVPRWNSAAVKAMLRRMVASGRICGTAWCRGLAGLEDHTVPDVVTGRPLKQCQDSTAVTVEAVRGPLLPTDRRQRLVESCRHVLDRLKTNGM
jgi:hypothetical protein